MYRKWQLLIIFRYPPDSHQSHNAVYWRTGGAETKVTLKQWASYTNTVHTLKMIHVLLLVSHQRMKWNPLFSRVQTRAARS